MEIRELTDVFANLADTKEVEKQVELFLPDGKLEFQIGIDGEINEIIGREALLQAFGGTVGPAKNVYHLNGQQTLTSQLWHRSKRHGTSWWSMPSLCKRSKGAQFIEKENAAGYRSI